MPQATWRALTTTTAMLAAFVATVSGGCRSSEAPASAPAASNLRLLVSNETGGTIDIVDPAAGTLETRVAVGKRPRGLKVSRDGTLLYVALSGSPIAPPGVDESTLPPPDRSADGIGVVDLASRKLLRTYPSGQDPESFDLSPDGRTLYVSNEETAEMSALDLASGSITRRVPVGEEPEGVTTSPDGRMVWVTCEGENTVVGVDRSTLEVVRQVKVAPRPRSIVFTADGRTMFVTGETGNAVSVVDPARGVVTATIALKGAEGDEYPPRPMGAVLSPDRGTVYVSNGRAKSVSVIDASTYEVTRTLPDIGLRPWGIDVSPDGQTIFTANGPSGDVSVIDVASGAVRRRIALGGSPWGVVTFVPAR
jgi:YVTN family beta-propeller protein